MPSSAKYLQSIANKRQKHEIIECLSNAIEYALGKGSSSLIFKTLKIVYHVDIESLHLNLVTFDNLMRRILGNKIADIILAEAIRLMEIDNG